ncbi:hypothetical protein [Microbacterium sp. 13-71-7]|jgi:hypothetical protein|nr:hypothetical protein [Microbacterium sp. 13-71-7]
MAAPRIVSIDLTHLVEAALRGERPGGAVEALLEDEEPGQALGEAGIR